MQEVWRAIRTGADAYLGRQLKTILPLIFILTGVLFLSVYIIPPSDEALQRFKNFNPDMVRLIVGIGRAIAFAFHDYTPTTNLKDLRLKALALEEQYRIEYPTFLRDLKKHNTSTFNLVIKK